MCNLAFDTRGIVSTPASDIYEQLKTNAGKAIKSVSMSKPGRTRQGVIMLKSSISLKLGTNVRYQELA